MTGSGGHIQFVCVSDRMTWYLLSVNEKTP